MRGREHEGRPVGHVRVLIVEDSEDDARRVARELTRGGYVPEWRRVETAEEMDLALDGGSWDVVVADHSLPAFDSLSALEVLKRRGIDVPFIIVSGAISEEAAVAAMRAGAHDYISKLSYGRLVPAVQRELREFGERRRAADGERRRQREAEALALIARETAENLALPVLTQRIADRVRELFDATTSVVRLRDAEGQLVAIAFAAPDTRALAVGHAIRAGAGVVGRAAAEGRIVYSADVLADARLDLPDDVRRLHETLVHRTILAAPLRVADTVIGTLSIGDTRVRHFPDSDLAFFQTFADQAALAVRNGQLLASEQAARAEAEALNQAKDEFVAMLAHELRNPLGAITTAVSVLERAVHGDTAARSREVISRQTRHLTRLVDDLLDVARAQTGKIALALEPMDLGQAVRDGVGNLAAAGRLARHTVDVDVAAVCVRADAARIEQITMNLVDNAVKHTPPGGEIRVRVLRRDNEAMLAVQDTGSGIAPDLLPRVFDLFTQGSRGLDRVEGGLGIGLTLVRRLVEQHGGRVDARSAGPGRGSEFVVCLPVHETAALTDQAVGSARGRCSARPGLRVLIVEDNADARDMLRSLLELDGHEVHQAADGYSGLEAAMKTEIDVALVDIGLPGMDGYELAQRLRQQRVNVPLVAITGYGRREDRERALAAGFTRHLVKPVAPEELTRVISELCYSAAP